MGVVVSPGSVLELLDGYLEFDGDLVAEFQCAEEAGVRRDAEVRLPDRAAPPVVAGGDGADLEADRLGDRVQQQGALDRAAAGRGGGLQDAGRVEDGLGGVAEDLARLVLDVATVAVAERLGAAAAPADGPGAEVEFG